MDSTHFGEHRLEGIILSVEPPLIEERATSSSLIFPDQLYRTNIHLSVLEQGTTTTRHTTIYGIVPSDYIGEKAILHEQFYSPLPGEQQKILVVQELYIEGRRVINQTVLRIL